MRLAGLEPEVAARRQTGVGLLPRDAVVQSLRGECHAPRERDGRESVAYPRKAHSHDPAIRARSGRRAEAQVETAASTTGAVAGATLNFLFAPGGRSARARPKARNARGRQDRQDRAPPPAAGRPRDRVPRGTCDDAPGSESSSTGNDTPSAAGVERVLWERRHREARPAGAPVAGSIVTGATQAPSMPWWSWPLGHSLGQTLPYWAASGPSPDATGLARFGRFAGIPMPEAATNASLHTREAGGSKPPAPISKRVPLAGTSLRRTGAPASQAEAAIVGSECRPPELARLRLTAHERIYRASPRPTRERSLARAQPWPPPRSHSPQLAVHARSARRRRTTRSSSGSSALLSRAATSAPHPAGWREKSRRQHNEDTGVVVPGGQVVCRRPSNSRPRSASASSPPGSR
jgi:hypothetical protein